MGAALIILACLLAISLVVIFIVMLPGLWFRALISGTYVSAFKLIRMRIKKLDVRTIVSAYIRACKSGVTVTIDQLENHVQAHGNIDLVVDACIAAVNGGINLPVKTAMAIDLSGRNIKEAIKATITPRVIETPIVTTVCKSGIEMSARAKITIKTNLSRLIGGAMEETIIARVCEGIVTCIGNASDHQELLEHPENISKQLIIDKDIASDAAFDILSIDISKIMVGRNVGAELAIDASESRKIIAQADAEQRRTDALALEQEMRALTQEMRARVVSAESLLPQAIAEALGNGTMSVTDFLSMDNLISDTQMRKKIAGVDNKDMVTTARKKSRLA